MKNSVLLGAILVIVLGGYFIFLSDTPSEHLSDSPGQSAVAVTGVITGINLEQVAIDGPAVLTIRDSDETTYTIEVPSMGIQLCAAYDNIGDVYTAAVGDTVTVSGIKNETGSIVPCEDPSHQLEINTIARDTVYGYEFAYRKGPRGYVTFEDTESTHPDYVTGITLFNKRDYDLFIESTDAREGPPAMHVRIYRNPQRLHPPVWVMQNPQESNIQLALEDEKETVVGGANAVFYTVDGLWPIDTYVVASGAHMYVLMGAYPDTTDLLYSDFDALVNSFTFIPEGAEVGASSVKIDPQVACQSALAYMTFEDGAAADAFIARCVAGEHPEVIEQYIKDMGFDETAM